jgi:hypothetical protein
MTTSARSSKFTKRTPRTQKVFRFVLFPTLLELTDSFILREKELKEKIRKLEDEIAHFEYSQTREAIFEDARRTFEAEKTKLIHDHNLVIK